MRGIVARFLLLAVVVGMTACSDDPEPGFEVEGSGSLEGLVFFDADKSGTFDPSAGDTPLPNVAISVLARGTQETLANGTGQTDASGRFVLSGIAPGSHSLVIDTATAGGVKFCLNPVPVTVFLSERQFLNVSGRQACIITIAAAEQLRNQVVVIQGIVTSAPDEIRASYTYVQDESGGIRIFSSALSGKGIAIGDRVELTGTISDFSADLQIGGTVTVGAITKDVTQVVPEIMTTAELVAAGKDASDPKLGILVTIKDVKFATAFGANGVNGRNAFLDDGSGEVQIRFEAGVFPGSDSNIAGAALSAQFPAGAKCYDITGVTGAFNGSGQIFPRKMADLQEVTCK